MAIKEFIKKLRDIREDISISDFKDKLSGEYKEGEFGIEETFFLFNNCFPTLIGDSDTQAKMYVDLVNLNKYDGFVKTAENDVFQPILQESSVENLKSIFEIFKLNAPSKNPETESIHFEDLFGFLYLEFKEACSRIILIEDVKHYRLVIDIKYNTEKKTYNIMFED